MSNDTKSLTTLMEAAQDAVTVILNSDFGYRLSSETKEVLENLPSNTVLTHEIRFSQRLGSILLAFYPEESFYYPIFTDEEGNDWSKANVKVRYDSSVAVRGDTNECVEILQDMLEAAKLARVVQNVFKCPIRFIIKTGKAKEDMTRTEAGKVKKGKA